GIQLLIAARKDEATKDIPFIIAGDKEDFRAGGLAQKVEAQGQALLVTAPLSQKQVTEAVLELLSPTVDRVREEAYAQKDAALEKAANNELEAAVELYQDSLQLYPGDLDCWLGLARAKLKLDRPDEAEKTFFKALEVDGSSMKAFLGLAEIYEQRKDYDQTGDILRQALSVARSMEASGQKKAKIHVYIGEFELRLARLEKAEEAFNQAIEEDPDNSELRSAIGDSYAKRGYYAESEKYYLSALEIDQDMAHVFNRLGIAYRRQGKYDRALELYEQARERHPEDEHLLFNMARTHFETNNRDEAVALIQEALELAPDFKEAKQLLSLVESGSEEKG
ncbi:MAG: tetratricopeptide repeat protein, partial [Deltaproteobacteria bacterium]|nr:tetratricopeptide repeat protein [Deltaproteobacteria bacterium]